MTDTKTKIIFLCHGNICRSPLAEFVMKDLIRKSGREQEFEIDSAAVSAEETGNPVYTHTKSLMRQKGIPSEEHRAHRITMREFDENDIVIVMDKSNLRILSSIVGKEKVYDSGKVHLLMEYAENENTSGRFSYPDVADPWYTRDFERSYQDILRGCKGLLESL